MPNLLDQGIFFFNDGRYFEAHEAWEEMWRQETGSLKPFCQGLVQAAVGLHHRSRGNRIGTESQLRKSLEKLDRLEPDEAGIDLESLRRSLRQVLSLPEDAQPAPIRIVRLKSPPGMVESDGTF